MGKYQSYKPSGIEWVGEIPEKWVLTKLHFLKTSKICEYQDGNHGSVHPKVEDFVDEGIPFLRPTDVFQGRIQWSDVRYIPEEYVSKLRIGFSKKGDILFVNRGNIGVTCILDKDFENHIIINPQLTYIRLDSELFNPLFFFYQTQSSIFKINRDLKLGNGSVLNFLGLGDLGEYNVIFPPIQDQLQIVQYLDKKTELIDSFINKTQRKIELLREKRLGLIEQIILDNTIDRVRLKYGVDLMNRPIDRKDGTSYTKIGMYNWGRGIFKYNEEEGSELGDSEFSFIREGDLLLSGQFSWEGSVSIVENEFDGCISSHRFYILNGKKDILITEYLWAFFTSQEGHLILDDNSIGSAGRNRPLNIGKLLKEKIPFPNIEVQKRIKDFVIKERENIKFSTKLISLLKEYRQSLISEVVTGKIKVTTNE